MGEVWLAHDEQLDNRPVAIKIMHKHLLPNAGDVARFEREARIAAAMDHPNIVTVYTSGSYLAAPYLVMEYLRGQDLERALPGGGAERVAAIGRDICGALAYAHGQGVIHRDIKPGNLFLCDTGQVKVTDFGIARAASGTTLSVAGTLVGTFGYMPPEQWRGAAPAFPHDVWAAGCVLYRLLAGRPPRVFPDPAGYAAAALRGDPVPGLRDISDTPDWLASVVMAMLDPDPARRPTAADCVRLLSGTSSMVPVPGQPSRGQPSRGQPSRGQPSRGRPGTGWAEPGPAGAAAAGPPATVAMTQPGAAGTADSRPRHPGRVAAVIGGVLAVLVTGSVIALRFHGSPQSSGTAAGSTSAPPAQRTATTPAASPTASRPGTATAPAPGYAAGSPSASRAAAPTASATVSTPAATAPPLVPVPDVVGMTFAKARLVLIDDGFKVVGRHLRPGQTVTSTSPHGQAPPGSAIIVVYGTGL
jgi:serine/threonine-protein kinase